MKRIFILLMAAVVSAGAAGPIILQNKPMPGTWVRTATYSSATNYASISIPAPTRPFIIRSTSIKTTTNGTFDILFMRCNSDSGAGAYLDQKHVRNQASLQLATTLASQVQACLVDGATATNTARSWVEIEFKNPTATNFVKLFKTEGEVAGAGTAVAYQHEQHTGFYNMATGIVQSIQIFPTSMFSNATTWEVIEEIQP